REATPPGGPPSLQARTAPPPLARPGIIVVGRGKATHLRACETRQIAPHHDWRLQRLPCNACKSRNDVPGIALIYFPAGFDSQPACAGRTLGGRPRALADAVGLRPYLVGAEHVPPALTLEPGDRLPAAAPADGTALLWRGDVVFAAGALRSLLAGPTDEDR